MGGLLVNQEGWLLRYSELVDGEPSMSKGVTAEDLLYSSKSTILKSGGVKGSVSVGHTLRNLLWMKRRKLRNVSHIVVW